MNKSFFNHSLSIIIILAGIALFGSLAFAQSSTNSSTGCVGGAVAVRETSLDAAMSADTQAISNAYTARASALALAYAQTDDASVKDSVKSAWSDFRSAMKSARVAWRSARNSAWSAFRVSVRACHAPVSISDSSNSISELSGQ